MLKVKISIDDGAGKKADIEINETDNLSKLVIVDKVFRLFGIESDVFEMVTEYDKIGKMYSSFFNEISPIEPEKLQKKNVNVNEIKEQLILGLNENKDELESTYKETKSTPEFMITGIKIEKDGVTKRYQLRYECPACFNRGTYYVFNHSKKTWCHRCQHEMDVLPATPNGFDGKSRDNFGNFFRAGEYRDMNLKWEW
ncbi:hypothetical protein Elgi_38780 [Paenibacillus elgii]|uniref:hypothetical protein n=1 Tax=Paenibacillus elgii TaxID=189691 RepID=UPI002D7A9694|nr:hypothetical protein Elgi_38780 [Paenibacillus elgii]